MLAWRLASEDFDLIGELLLSGLCIKMEWSAYCDLAWLALAEARKQLCELPSPNFDRSHLEALPLAEASAYKYRHSYHTTYIFGLLCAYLLCLPSTVLNALARSAGTDLTSVVPERDALAQTESRSELLNRLLKLADPDGKRSFLRSAALSSAVGIDSLAAVLVDCALVRSARAYEPAAVANSLLEVVRLSLSASQVSLDAWQFLARQNFRLDAHQRSLPQASPELLKVMEFIASALSLFARFVRETRSPGALALNVQSSKRREKKSKVGEPKFT
jgi:hypothetical protein